MPIRMIRSQSARLRCFTSPWRGEAGERRRREPGGGETDSPHPGSSPMLAADPPPPGEGGADATRRTISISRATRASASGMFGAALIAALAGCGDEVGYVEVKTFPGFNVPLYLDTVKLEAPFKNGTTVVRHEVGKTKLQLERGGQFFALCEFDVRKNRIVSVKLTLAGFERVPRCELKQ
jgi:hypothetical protein